MRRLLVSALMLIVLAGCSPPATRTPALDVSPTAMTWPPPPELARYGYAGTLIGEKDFLDPGKKDQAASFGLRVLEIVTGLVFGEDKTLELRRPVGGMIDGAGRILVTDASHPGVLVFDMPGQKVLRWTMAGENDTFRTPVGIAPDGRGGYWVADSELARVVRLDAAGLPVGALGAGELVRPTGLAFDAAAGELYVADTQAHIVAVYDSDGRRLRTLGRRGEAPGEFNFPTHLTLHGGALYVSDTLNFRVQKLAPDGASLAVIGELGDKVGNMNRPKGVAVGGDGRIYVVESLHDFVLVYDREGRFLLPLGGTGTEEGLFYGPAGVWTDASGRVFVADMFNGRISVFSELTRGPDS